MADKTFTTWVWWTDSTYRFQWPHKVGLGIAIPQVARQMWTLLARRTWLWRGQMGVWLVVRVRVWSLISHSTVAPANMLRRRLARPPTILGSSRVSAARLIVMLMMTNPALLPALVGLITLSRSVRDVYKLRSLITKNNYLPCSVDIKYLLGLLLISSVSNYLNSYTNT